MYICICIYIYIIIYHYISSALGAKVADGVWAPAPSKAQQPREAEPADVLPPALPSDFKTSCAAVPAMDPVHSAVVKDSLAGSAESIHCLACWEMLPQSYVCKVPRYCGTRSVQICLTSSESKSIRRRYKRFMYAARTLPHEAFASDEAYWLAKMVSDGMGLNNVALMAADGLLQPREYLLEELRREMRMNWRTRLLSSDAPV